jgi:hypothetical protein
MGKPAWWSGQEKEFEQWIFETDTAKVRTCKALDISAGPEVSDEQFRQQVASAAQVKAEAESSKLEISSKAKETTLKSKIEKQQAKVDKLQSELASRGLDTALKVGNVLLNLAAKKKLTGVSSSASKVRMASDAKGRLDEAKTVLEGYQEELKNMQQSQSDGKQALVDQWLAEGQNVDEIALTPTKQNIRITYFGIGWKS